MRYPEATWKGDGQSGGSYIGLPFRVVLHTTETSGVPGYGDGATAPHITYVPATGKWVQHTDFNTAARALRNVAGGVQTNRANSLQVEIVCYSAKNIADQRASRLWVGDLTDDHYQDLRDFLAWTYSSFSVSSTWPGKQAFSSSEANASGFRMSDVEWNEFGGVCAHQHVPENTHWDTGALDWTRVIEREAMLPLNFGDDSEDVRLAKDRINLAYGTKLNLQSTVYDDVLRAAAATHLGRYTGERAGKSGDKINAKMWNGLLKDFTAKFGSSPIGVTEARVNELIAASSIVPSDG